MIVASLLLEQLCKVVLAVEDAIERGIGWWRKGAPSMRALETGLVVWLSLHSYLFQRVCCFLAAGTFVLGPREHIGHLARGPIQFILILCTCWEFLGKAACLLKELFKVRFAVEDPIHGRVVAHRKISFAVAAFEAGLVIGNPICRQEIDEMDGLVACLAFVLGAAERHGDNSKANILVAKVEDGSPRDQKTKSSTSIFVIYSYTREYLVRRKEETFIWRTKCGDGSLPLNLQWRKADERRKDGREKK